MSFHEISFNDLCGPPVVFCVKICNIFSSDGTLLQFVLICFVALPLLDVIVFLFFRRSYRRCFAKISCCSRKTPVVIVIS